MINYFTINSFIVIFHIFLIYFFNAKENKMFLVKGISNKKPIKSVKKPGIINRNAATAIDAPKSFHKQESCFDIS